MNESGPWSKRYSAEYFKKLFQFFQEVVQTASFTRKAPPLKELRPLLCAFFVFGAAVCSWRGEGVADYATGTVALAAFAFALPREENGD